VKMLSTVHVNREEWINSLSTILQSGNCLHATEEGEGEHAALRAVLGSLLKQNDDDQLVIICKTPEKQIQIAFKEIEFQSQFWVGPTTIKVWLISNQTLINCVLL